MNKKYYIAPSVKVEYVETESLCAASGSGVSDDGGTGVFGDSPKGDAGEACGKIQINDVWE